MDGIGERERERERKKERERERERENTKLNWSLISYRGGEGGEGENIIMKRKNMIGKKLKLLFYFFPPFFPLSFPYQVSHQFNGLTDI